MDALRFTLIEALLSTLLTVVLGLPVAWSLGRYQWRGIRSKRALFYLPFVTPPIVAAAGFLALISPGGLFSSFGLDLRGETGFIGWLAETTGWQHPGHMIALVLAHAWFNLSLMIRFVEPVIAQLNPAWEEQLMMLPKGQSASGRLRHLWLPVLGPSVAVAAT
jgi:thiamine transport system permease protein